MRPVLEYCSVIWTPVARAHIDRIERVQRVWIRFATSRLLAGPYAALLVYESRCWLLGLESLEIRYKHAQSLFVASFLYNQTDAFTLLSSFSIYVPNRSFFIRLSLLIPRHHSACGRNDPFLRALSSFKSSCNLFDFNISLSVFRLRSRSSINSSSHLWPCYFLCFLSSVIRIRIA